MAILPVGIGSAEEGGYQIERSLRFNSADSAYLNRTPGTASNRKTWTWSGWVKKSVIAGDYPPLFNAGQSAPDTVLRFSDADVLNAILENGGGGNSRLDTTQVFRDSSAWYHIVWAVDTTLATANDRQRLYVNGVEVTAFSTRTNPSLNFDTQVNNTVEHRIGGQRYASYYNGYLTEINFIDGQALDPTSFGEYNEDTGVWQPKAYTGSYGTNGFYLNFSDNSGTTSTTLGKDQAGSNNWTPNNFSVTAGAGNDSLVDTPTNYGTDTGVGGEVRGNYCTWNPLDNGGIDLSNGNLGLSNGAAHEAVRSTFKLPSSGKWYAECTLASFLDATNVFAFGVDYSNNTVPAHWNNTGKSFIAVNSTLLLIKINNTETFTSATTTGAVLRLAYNADTQNLWLGFNGNWYDAAFNTTGNPETGVNPTQSSVSDAFLSANIYQTTGNLNTGQRPFAYTAPSGFKALCTQNLPEPTIVDGGEYFNSVLYTGDGAASRSITGVGFQPDWVWVKTRSVSDNHNVFDAVRGVQKRLFSNLTNAEDSTSGTLTSFDSDGFSLGSNLDMNTNGVTLVAWNWKANGAGVSNTDGTITSTVSANTDSGFSIVTYTGNGTAGATVGHGLGVTPAMVIIKSRSLTGSTPSANWAVWHQSISQAIQTSTTIVLNSYTGAIYLNFNFGSSSYSIDAQINGSTQTYVAYCFAEVEGFSKFGSYTGNGSADGPFVYTGFRPAWVLIKQSSAAGENWRLIDSTRSPFNQANKHLAPSSSAAESTETGWDIVSNGFKLRNADAHQNGNGATYIYAAFAENPFKYSLAR
jgi:hypothetical protein